MYTCDVATGPDDWADLLQPRKEALVGFGPGLSDEVPSTQLRRYWVPNTIPLIRLLGLLPSYLGVWTLRALI